MKNPRPVGAEGVEVIGIGRGGVQRDQRAKALLSRSRLDL
jgi:hypothetical protein